MPTVKFENDNVVLSFSKNLISDDAVQNFIEWLRIEEIAQKSKMTEEQAWELSEEIKRDWWEKNKERFLERVRDEETGNS